MRIVFMGTPNFAAEVLEALVKAGHEIALAVTQPDKPKGRGTGIKYRSSAAPKRQGRGIFCAFAG